MDSVVVQLMIGFAEDYFLEDEAVSFQASGPFPSIDIVDPQKQMKPKEMMTLDQYPLRMWRHHF